MSDRLIEMSKTGLRSIFTVKKYDRDILVEDLDRILFIGNYIEESMRFVKENYKEVNAEKYFDELKKYALELFLMQCREAIPEKEKNSEDFDLEAHQKEDAKYFNYIYDNLKYPE